MDPDLVSLDPAELSLYDRDAAPLPASAKWAFNPRPDAVVRPRIADQVRKVVRFAAKAGVPVVPRGAATWGFGGAVPANGGIVFDLQGLSDITVDRDTMTVHRRKVTTGELTGTDSIQILDGLQSGEMIAISGVSRLREGMKVRHLEQ